LHFSKILRYELFFAENYFVHHQDNYAGSSTIMRIAAKSFASLATSLNILYNYFDDLNKIVFQICI